MVDLAHLHDRQLAALSEFDRICALLGLRYTLVAGSLLGCVRHGGFIPWDDDVDVAMLRDDYVELLASAPQLLDGGYFLQTGASDPSYCLPYAKLRVNGTFFPEPLTRGVSQHQGIFIDIFPLDPAPDSRIGRTVHGQLSRLLMNLSLLASDYNISGAAGPLKRALRWAIRPIGVRGFARARETLLRRTPGGVRFYVNTAGSHPYRRELVEIAVFDSLNRRPFEGRLFPTPAEPEVLLRRMYGDFEQLPPLEVRVPRHLDLKAGGLPDD